MQETSKGVMEDVVASIARSPGNEKMDDVLKTNIAKVLVALSRHANDNKGRQKMTGYRQVAVADMHDRVRAERMQTHRDRTAVPKTVEIFSDDADIPRIQIASDDAVAGGSRTDTAIAKKGLTFYLQIYGKTTVVDVHCFTTPLYWSNLMTIYRAVPRLKNVVVDTIRQQLELVFCHDPAFRNVVSDQDLSDMMMLHADQWKEPISSTAEMFFANNKTAGEFVSAFSAPPPEFGDATATSRIPTPKVLDRMHDVLQYSGNRIPAPMTNPGADERRETIKKIVKELQQKDERANLLTSDWYPRVAWILYEFNLALTELCPVYYGSDLSAGRVLLQFENVLSVHVNNLLLAQMRAQYELNGVTVGFVVLFEPKCEVQVLLTRPDNKHAIKII